MSINDRMNFRYMVMDTVSVIECLARMVPDCNVEEQREAIIARVESLLEDGWSKVFKQSLLMPDPKMEWQIFWDSVAQELKSNGKVHTFFVHYGENVNPPGDRGNVRFSIQPKVGDDVFWIRLKLIGSLSKEEADLVWEKVDYTVLLTSGITR
jgi:hypothetical protein